MSSQAKYTKAEINNLTFAYITGWLPKGLHFKTKQKLRERLVHYTEIEDQIDTFYARGLLKNTTSPPKHKDIIHRPTSRRSSSTETGTM